MAVLRKKVATRRDGDKRPFVLRYVSPEINPSDVYKEKKPLDFIQKKQRVDSASEVLEEMLVTLKDLFRAEQKGIGKELQNLAKHSSKLNTEPQKKIDNTAIETEKEFREYLSKWRKETRFLSNWRDIVLNDNHQYLLTLGKPILPFLLTELTINPTNLFYALSKITKFDPTTEEDRKDIFKMVEAWLEWGRKEKIIS